MSDIVKRLRALAEDYFEFGGEIDGALFEAASEIERLREALEQIASGGLFQHAHEFARAALAREEKKP